MNPSIQPQQVEKKENFLKEIVKFAVIALVIIVPLRTWVAEPFIVSGLSMYPTFNNAQYLIVDQLTYDFHQPQRGDVVIFKYPLDPKTYFIKRVIGLPGETVSIADGVVTIIKPTATSTKIFALSEPYIASDHRSYDNFKTTLSSSEYFVMGDNRNQSSDSRVWGNLDQKYIVGRPYLRLLPPGVLPGRIDLGNN
ncbi:MAG: signal peptidase I [bacterium]